MKKIIILLFIILLINCQGKLFGQNRKLLNDIKNCWQVKDYKYQKVIALTIEEIRSYSKHIICLNDEKVYLFIDTLYQPKFKFKKIDRTYLLNNYGISINNFFWSNRPLFEINIKEGVPKGVHYNYLLEYDILYDGVYLYIVEDGLVFRLRKINKMKNG